MNDVPVPGPVPRFDIAEWRELGIVAGVTGRGPDLPPFDLGLAGSSTPVGTVIDHWRALHSSMPGFSAVVVSRHVHGTEVRWQDPSTGLVIQEGADGHATNRAGVLLAVTLADCVPVYVVDPIARLAALLHAGWRGTAAGILARGVGVLSAHGASVDRLLIHCGVGICGRCYEVGSEVFAACGVDPPAEGKGRLDLRGVLARQARELGVSHVSTSQWCSAHDRQEFFSHRGSGGADGRMVGYLGFSV